MWSRSRNSQGYTLVEVLIVLASMVVILSLAAQMLFETSRLTSRQESQVEPRQTVRSGLDYVTFVVRGACDFNRNPTKANEDKPFPNALLFWYSKGSGSASGCPGGTNCVQASYNTITTTQAGLGIGDVGTDIIAVIKPWNTAVCGISSALWNFQTATTSNWDFNLGCSSGGDAANMALFKQLTGAHSSGGADISRRLTIFEDSGDAGFTQITGYTKSDCSVAKPYIQVQHLAGSNQDINIPGGTPGLGAGMLALGTRFVTLRVCQGWLEEKDGILEYTDLLGTTLIASDQCPQLPIGTTEYPPYLAKTGWIPLLPQVEDLQYAYVYRDGNVFNDRVGHIIASTGGIPRQGSAVTTDSAFIRAVRVTLTSRSTKSAPGEVHARYIRPAGEDRLAAPGPDKFYHFQQSVMVILRSRNPNV